MKKLIAMALLLIGLILISGCEKLRNESCKEYIINFIEENNISENQVGRGGCVWIVYNQSVDELSVNERFKLEQLTNCLESEEKCRYC